MTGLRSPAADDPRAAHAYRWALAALGLPEADFAPASADASFRRYFRLRHESQSWIVMDAPPQHENCRPFVAIAARMQAAGMHVPEVLAQDLESGYLLLTDLGTRTYLDVIDDTNADALFEPAIAALIRWQAASRPGVLPEYDAALLARELALFPDWYLARHRNVTLRAAEQTDWQRVCDLLIESALEQPRVFVHRDFMPRNLMLSQPLPAPLTGVLDFQDAVYGPIAYDPICLFKDAFLSWPEARVDGWLRRYYDHGTAAGLPLPAYPQFRRDADWIGVQRHLKVLGIFARICHRDGKPKYLADAPRFIRYVMEVAARYPELAPLARLFERHVLTGEPAPEGSA